MEFLGLVNYALFTAIFIGIYALLALGLNIQWGFAGLFNAGIAGFFAVGAYTSAILSTPPDDGRIGGFDLHFVLGWIGAMLAALLYGHVPIPWSPGRSARSACVSAPTIWRSPPSGSRKSYAW